MKTIILLKKDYEFNVWSSNKMGESYKYYEKAKERLRQLAEAGENECFMETIVTERRITKYKKDEKTLQSNNDNQDKQNLYPQLVR